MAVSIVTTLGGASSNSYVTQAEATTYLEGRLNTSSWDSASTDSKNRALVEAARELNTYAWQGRKAADAQALQWPRDWVTDPDSPSAFYFDNTEIPQRVKDAQVELALEFLRSGTTDLAAVDPNAGVIEKRIDVIVTRWDSAASRPSGMQRFPRIMRLIAPLMEGARAGQLNLVRG